MRDENVRILPDMRVQVMQRRKWLGRGYSLSSLRKARPRRHNRNEH